MWGYLLSLTSLSYKTEHPGGHVTRSDGAGMVSLGNPSKYGFVRPWPDDMDETTSAWEKRGREDYYVNMSAGTRNGQPLISTGTVASPFYPQRLFVWGMQGGAEAMPRDTLMRYLAELGFFASSSFWCPCLPHRGYNMGSPTFHEALRADTDIGPTGYTAKEYIEKAVKRDPDRWAWDPPMFEGGPGTLYIRGGDE